MFIIRTEWTNIELLQKQSSNVELYYTVDTVQI